MRFSRFTPIKSLDMAEVSASVTAACSCPPVAQPAASFGGVFLHEDLFEMAAAYLYSLVNNHPFVDGNKRVGATAAGVFLKINGFAIHASNHELADLVLGVAQGAIEKKEVAQFLRSRSVA